MMLQTMCYNHNHEIVSLTPLKSITTLLSLSIDGCVNAKDIGHLTCSLESLSVQGCSPFLEKYLLIWREGRLPIRHVQSDSHWTNNNPTRVEKAWYDWPTRVDLFLEGLVF